MSGCSTSATSANTGRFRRTARAVRALSPRACFLSASSFRFSSSSRGARRVSRRYTLRPFPPNAFACVQRVDAGRCEHDHREPGLGLAATIVVCHDFGLNRSYSKKLGSAMRAVGHRFVKPDPVSGPLELRLHRPLARTRRLGPHLLCADGGAPRLGLALQPLPAQGISSERRRRSAP